jgi:hypothetical protein
MDSDAALHAQLAHTLADTGWTTMAGRGALVRYDGKVRDCYIDAARGERIIVVTDRLSAFDQVIGLIPWKGQVLNQMAQHWFAATAHLAPQPRRLLARSQRDDRARGPAAGGSSW